MEKVISNEKEKVLIVLSILSWTVLSVFLIWKMSQYFLSLVWFEFWVIKSFVVFVLISIATASSIEIYKRNDEETKKSFYKKLSFFLNAIKTKIKELNKN